MVLAYHLPAKALLTIPGYIQHAAWFGWVGVDLFFVLSGYLVGSQALNMDASRPATAQLATFWCKRWMRTLPLYFAVLLVYVFKDSLFGYDFVGGNFRFAFFLQNYGPLHDFVQSWSLCVEEHFYLALPLLVVAFGRARLRPAVWIGFIVASILVRLWYTREAIPVDDVSMVLDWPTHTHVDGLAAGVFLASTARTWKAWHPILKRSLGIAGLVVLLAGFLAFGARLDAQNGALYFTMLAVAFSLMLIAVEDLVLPSLIGAPIYFVALLSYGAYLWFGLAGRAAEKIGGFGGPAIETVVFLGLTFGAAWSTYVLVERPALVWRERILPRLGRSPKTHS